MIPMLQSASSLVDRILTAFRSDERNSDRPLPEDTVLRPIANDLVNEMYLFERSLGRVTPDIDLVWVVSGPGRWNAAAKDDRYAQHSWARWLDRQRIEIGADLVRAVTVERLGYVSSNALMERGPRLFYNGRRDEVLSFLTALDDPELGIPRMIASIADGFSLPNGDWRFIETTVDNVRAFHLPATPIPYLNGAPPRSIAIVSHPPQLSRLLRILNHWRTTPAESRIRLFPVRTPIDGRDDYICRDVQSALAHIFLMNDATVEPYPAVL